MGNKRRHNGAAGAAAVLEGYSPAGRVFLWVEPALSVGVLVSGILTLMSMAWFSAISIFANVMLLGVLFGVGSKIYVHLMGMLKKSCKDPLAQLAVVDLTITEDCISDLVKSLVDGYNLVASEGRRLILGENIYDSVKFGLVLYMLTIVGSIFNTLTLIGIIFVLSFILPTVYYDNQETMDELFEKMKSKYTAIDAKVAAVFPGQKTENVEKIEMSGDKQE